ncbi:MAG: bifunctional folylpolyglutamate synthase/dihydrofolate synthase [Chloroflexi bacterium]|nr:bifunctional folylpolyglutamate synthase/dihydrofolate synthase [Chloroflexota bacterium]
MNYTEAIAYLHRLTDYEKTRIERYTPETLDLTRVERLLTILGNPHTQFPTLHIAGTKGKGSTAAMCEACLRAAGYRTGFYTSPHLHTFRERIQVAGRLIEREEVVDLVEEIRSIIDSIPGLTTFEAITALAFVYFARCSVDIAVVEVGLGGRLDATNVVTPEISVITSLSLDHTYLLGDTLAEIAYEKAGIIKPGIPVVCAPQPIEALEVIESISQERSSPLSVIGRDWSVKPGHTSLDGQSLQINRMDNGVSDFDGDYWIPLLGRYQLENAATAVAALDALRARGFEIPVEAVRMGLSQVYWPGRLEIISRDPVVVVDCAHNPYSVQMLRQAVEELFPDMRWVLIFGASADKSIREMLVTLLPLSDYVIVTRSEHPRAATPMELADIVAELGSGAEVSVNVRKAIQRGLAVMPAGGGLLVTGSIFVVADAEEEWASLNGMPMPDNDRPMEA